MKSKAPKNPCLILDGAPPAGVESKSILGEVKCKVAGVVIPTGVSKSCLVVDEAAAVLPVVTEVFKGVTRVKLLSNTL